MTSARLNRAGPPVSASLGVGKSPDQDQDWRIVCIRASRGAAMMKRMRSNITATPPLTIENRRSISAINRNYK